MKTATAAEGDASVAWGTAWSELWRRHRYAGGHEAGAASRDGIGVLSGDDKGVLSREGGGVLSGNGWGALIYSSDNSIRMGDRSLVLEIINTFDEVLRILFDQLFPTFEW